MGKCLGIEDVIKKHEAIMDTADPKKDPKAKKYASLKYETALEKRLKVMDSAAFALCMDNGIPIVVFDFFDKNALEGVIKGKTVGTIVS